MSTLKRYFSSNWLQTVVSGSQFRTRAIPRSGNPQFQSWEACVLNAYSCSTWERLLFSTLTVSRHGNARFAGWQAWVPTLGNPELLDMGTQGSKVVDHEFSNLHKRSFAPAHYAKQSNYLHAKFPSESSQQTLTLKLIFIPAH